MIHPRDRASRRSVAARALELRQFAQKKIDGKKNKHKAEIEEKETEDELYSYRNSDLNQDFDESGI